MKEKVQKITVDRQLRIQNFSGNFLQRFWGETLKTGQQLHRRLHTLGWMEAAAALVLAVKHGKTAAGDQASGTLPLILHWLIEPWIEEEQVQGAILSITDVTWERRLQRQQNLASRMNTMSQFAREITTRLNNPLAAILNQIGCLLMEEENGEEWNRIRQELTGIQEQIYELSLVTHALDSFSRDDSQSGKLVQLNAILEKAVEVVQLLTAQKGVGLVLSTSPDHAIIYANEIVLEQCFLNLLQNAVEASPAGGEVAIRSETSDGMVTVTIKDSGGGIDPAEIERVFEPFYTTKADGHLGLGLSISYAIAAQYKGLLELENAPGGGITASLQFPIAKSLIKKG